MIEIYDSLTDIASANIQFLLNKLANDYSSDFHEIVYDQSDSTQINQIWVSEKVYLDYSNNALQIKNKNGFSVGWANMNRFFIVKTDSVILIHNGVFTTVGNGAQWMAITKTKDSNNKISKGIVAIISPQSSVISVFSDNMSLENTYGTYSRGLPRSIYNTVLAPTYAITGDENFEDVYLAILHKSTDSGKIILNGQKFYMVPGIAIAYT